ncbi:MAG TPA: type IV pilus modification protein PilV, partial [Marinobacter sp.]|nr:type IV pilus modification protein PilV [Marinobacter sp.]
IGLLGLASLQTTGLAQTSEIRNRTQAILLIDDMFERIRANRTDIASYAVAAGTAPACDKDYAISNTSVATDDVAEWQNSLGCLLPGGNGVVTINNRVVTVGVTWATNTGSTDDGTVTMEARL